MDKRTNETLHISQLTGNSEPPPKMPKRPASYDTLLSVDPDHHLVKKYDDAMKVYNDYWEAVSRERAVEPEPKSIKQLVDLDFVSVYKLFKALFFKVHGKEFNGEENAGEAKKLAYTLIYHFFHHENFCKSPLIYTLPGQEVDRKKGLLIIGGYGCGKTSIIKAIREMLFEANKNPDLTVLDIDGDEVQLYRYRKLFAYYSCNDLVQDYEKCATNTEKDAFWNRINKGDAYFDDLTSERQASNYGKIELFKDILEIRYDKGARTTASLNFSVEDGEFLSVEETLKKIGEKYGNRVFDRMYEMFNVIKLNGKSLRK